jgi:hypothetical protein
VCKHGRQHQGVAGSQKLNSQPCVFQAKRTLKTYTFALLATSSSLVLKIGALKIAGAKNSSNVALLRRFFSATVKASAIIFMHAWIVKVARNFYNVRSTPRKY